MIKACPSCNSEFETTNSRKVYCSDKCKLRNHKELNAKEQTCKQCSKTFYSYKAKEFCGVECRKQHTVEHGKGKRTKKPKEVKECLQCGIKYEAFTREYCSEKCRHKHTYISVKEQKVVKCKECDESFVTTDARQLFCSDRCNKKFHRRKREFSKRINHKHNGDSNWDISAIRLMGRDEGICYLCGGHCDAEDYITIDDGTIVTGERYPSVEHVIPLSKGGTHTWDNVKLAHRGCNSAKGTQLVGE